MPSKHEPLSTLSCQRKSKFQTLFCSFKTWAILQKFRQNLVTKKSHHSQQFKTKKTTFINLSKTLNVIHLKQYPVCLLWCELQLALRGKSGSKCHRKSLLNSIVWLLGPHQIVWIVSRNTKTIQRKIRQTSYSEVKREHTLTYATREIKLFHVKHKCPELGKVT